MHLLDRVVYDLRSQTRGKVVSILTEGMEQGYGQAIVVWPNGVDTYLLFRTSDFSPVSPLYAWYDPILMFDL